ncbi:class I SAM-dependent methyltransferase [Novosphingobium flavum]|uniref:Class I SAM-dependent methyltransferase n=1 Tax=Novosphingobium aerophilum TaxID=2839843 RepID=A0A7X1F8S4_9SPHN|nr:class I SAM-dependent methyltransferase [Novosphingobium aerophilum]MBC2652094.1 class I SAM-dependent methyltransferase [Novosphingobium aerophilum]MBC2660477.1 class I SAM-dependent methyltransferase [Novosphingobium aerophilum]
MSGCIHCQATSSDQLFVHKGYRLVRCSGCGLAYIANPPSAAELAELYAAEGGGTYHAQLRDPANPEVARMAQIAERHLDFVRTVATTGRLVDLGCSTGAFLGKAKAAGFEASGIEYARDSAHFAAEMTGCPVEHGTLADSSVAPGSLDVLCAFDVIEHVPDPADDLARMYGLLKPGGWLVLSTPNIDGLFPRLSFPLAGVLGHWPHPEPPHHLYQFSVATLSAMLRTAGFEPGPVRHCNIDLSYTFGQFPALLRMPQRLAYAMVFAPFAKLGPLVGMGDWFYIAARKPA